MGTIMVPIIYYMKKNKNLRELTAEELQEKIDFLKNNNRQFRVFYGYAKLTKKIVRKRELAVYFENGRGSNNDKYIHQKIHVVYTRIQTWVEMTDWDIGNRMFTKYGVFIDEDPFNGNLELALENNYLADQNYISEEERELIRHELRISFSRVYKSY